MRTTCIGRRTPGPAVTGMHLDQNRDLIRPGTNNLLEITWDTINPDFERGEAYRNQAASFQDSLLASVYLIGVCDASIPLTVLAGVLDYTEVT